MATRFYLSSTKTTPVTPSFEGGWSRNTEGDRREMDTVKDASAFTDKTFWAGTSPTANQTALCRQYVSRPMEAGIGFTTSDTVKCVVRCLESAVNDNINRTPICVKVVSEDGTTVRATLLALGHVGPNTTEWNNSLRNKQAADGDVLTTGYTTVKGDRLVIELGGQVDATGGTSVTGTMNFGSNSSTDLAENETGTAADNPWFEISRNITFLQVEHQETQFAMGCQRLAQSLAAAASLLMGQTAIAQHSRSGMDYVQPPPPVYEDTSLPRIKIVGEQWAVRQRVHPSANASPFITVDPDPGPGFKRPWYIVWNRPAKATDDTVETVQPVGSVDSARPATPWVEARKITRRATAQSDELPVFVANLDRPQHWVWNAAFTIQKHNDSNDLQVDAARDTTESPRWQRPFANPWVGRPKASSDDLVVPLVTIAVDAESGKVRPWNAGFTIQRHASSDEIVNASLGGADVDRRGRSWIESRVSRPRADDVGLPVIPPAIVDSDPAQRQRPWNTSFAIIQHRDRYDGIQVVAARDTADGHKRVFQWNDIRIPRRRSTDDVAVTLLPILGVDPGRRVITPWPQWRNSVKHVQPDVPVTPTSITFDPNPQGKRQFQWGDTRWVRVKASDPGATFPQNPIGVDIFEKQRIRQLRDDRKLNKWIETPTLVPEVSGGGTTQLQAEVLEVLSHGAAPAKSQLNAVVLEVLYQIPPQPVRVTHFWTGMLGAGGEDPYARVTYLSASFAGAAPFDVAHITMLHQTFIGFNKVNNVRVTFLYVTVLRQRVPQPVIEECPTTPVECVEVEPTPVECVNIPTFVCIGLEPEVRIVPIEACPPIGGLPLPGSDTPPVEPPIPPETITIESPMSPIMQVGEVYMLTVRVLGKSPPGDDPDSQVPLGGRTVQFGSTNALVATVGASAVTDADGYATVAVAGVGVGSYEIRVVCEGVQGDSLVGTVIAATPAPISGYGNISGGATINGTGNGGIAPNGYGSVVAGVSITGSGSVTNPAGGVGAVSAGGFLTGSGIATDPAPTPDPITGVANVAAGAAVLGSGSFTPLSPGDGNIRAGAVVSGSGSATNPAGFAAVSAGATLIGSGSFTPPPPPPQTVQVVNVTPASAAGVVGSTIVLSADPRDGNGNHVAAQTVIWNTSNSLIATVGPDSGTENHQAVVTLLAPGAVIISATVNP